MTKPTKRKKVKPVKAWAITRNGAFFSGVWERRKDAENVVKLWRNNAMCVVRVEIRVIP